MNTPRWTLLWTMLLGIGGCSLWIDDFHALNDTEGDSNSDDAENTLTGNNDDSADSSQSHLTDTSPLANNDTVTAGAPPCKEITAPSGDKVAFCPVSGGSWQMGCNPDETGEVCESDELPAHSVTTAPFEMMRTEVTNHLFAAFIQANPAWIPGGQMATANCNGQYLSYWFEGSPPGSAAMEPVTEICWYAADAFCRWITAGGSLPTEAQWERGARGDHDGLKAPYRIYPTADQPSCATANYSGCFGAPVDVGSTNGPSPFGILDMAGNVMEWTSDWYHGNYYCDPTATATFLYPDCNEVYLFDNPKGPVTGLNKVIRGGSWYGQPSDLRTAKRIGQSVANGTNLIGFRCVR